MFPSEIEILVAADKVGGSKSQLMHSKDVVGEYIGYLYDSLIRRGFIAGNRLTGYKATAKGRKRILEHRSKGSDTLRRTSTAATEGRGLAEVITRYYGILAADSRRLLYMVSPRHRKQ